MLCSPIQNHRYPLANLTAKARYLSVTRADQISSVAVAGFLELQGRVQRVSLQQSELLVSTCADAGGQGAIIAPEIRVGAVDHYAGPLEGLCVSGLVVGQGAIDAVVDASGVKIGLKLGVNRLRIVLVRPYI